MVFSIGILVLFIIGEFWKPLFKTQKLRNWFWICANLIAFPFLIPHFNEYFNRFLKFLGAPSLLNISTMHIVFQFIVFLLIVDFIKYVHHYCLHHFNFLWKIHSVHHSSTSIDVTASFKISWLESLTAIFVNCLLGRLLLVDESIVLAMNYLVYFACLWQHSNIDYSSLKLDFTRKLLITPLTHRIHHERLEGMKHRNLGLVLSVWDRLFGTCQESPKSSVYGIESEDYPYESDIKQFVYPFGAAKTSKTR